MRLIHQQFHLQVPYTFMESDDDSKTSVTDNWRTSDDPKAKQPRRFKGKTQSSEAPEHLNFS